MEWIRHDSEISASVMFVYAIGERGVICNVRYPGGSLSFLAVVLSGSPVSVFLSAVHCWWANVLCVLSILCICGVVVSVSGLLWVRVFVLHPGCVVLGG